MFDRLRQRHPRLNRWDRILGVIVGAMLTAGLESKLIVGGLLGASRHTQRLWFVVLLSATLTVVAWSARRTE